MGIDQRWLLAGAALVSGLVIGAVVAALARRFLGDPARRPALRSIAGPTGLFLFWICVAAGIVIAIGVTAPDTLRPIPGDLLAWLPRVLAAGLILLAGYAGGGAVSVAVAASAQRALGRRPAGLEQALRWALVGAAAVLALANLGVQTILLQILVAGAVAGLALALALIAGLGGQTVAASVAAGRTLGPDLQVGDLLEVGELSGTITAIRPATVVLAAGTHGTDGDDRLVVPLELLMRQPFRVTTPAGHTGAHDRAGSPSPA